MKSTKKRVGLVVLSLILFLCNSGLVIASEPGEMNAKGQIADLMVCYASGADAIGDGVTQADPEAAGLAIFETCFTEDATFALWPTGWPFDSPTFPDRDGVMPPLLIIIGPAAWASFTNFSFRSAAGVGYDFVQHLIGNTHIEVNGNHGTLVAYLNSTHIIQGPGPFAPSRCTQQAVGTYSLHVEKIEGSWKITSLDLTQSAFNAIIENGAGCSPEF